MKLPPLGLWRFTWLMVKNAENAENGSHYTPLVRGGQRKSFGDQSRRLDRGEGILTRYRLSQYRQLAPHFPGDIRRRQNLERILRAMLMRVVA